MTWEEEEGQETQRIQRFQMKNATDSDRKVSFSCGPLDRRPTSKVGFWPFQVGQPSAILILPALVSRMPPKTSSMYPSSISRALCSDRMRCITPLAPSRNETNSSRVSGVAVEASLGIFSYYGPHQIHFV